LTRDIEISRREANRLLGYVDGKSRKKRPLTNFAMLLIYMATTIWVFLMLVFLWQK
jgi:hypothetical protein